MGGKGFSGAPAAPLTPPPLLCSLQPLHAAVFRRFLETHVLLLAPICPHYAEAAWRGPLGHADGPSVTRAPFPAARPIDAVLVAQDAYLQAKLHAFRVAISKVRGCGAEQS